MASSLVDESVQSSIVSGMSMEAAAAAGSRTRSWDQLAVNSQSSWTNAFVSPTILGAEAIGVLNRTRNNPTPVIQS